MVCAHMYNLQQYHHICQFYYVMSRPPPEDISCCYIGCNHDVILSHCSYQCKWAELATSSHWHSRKFAHCIDMRQSWIGIKDYCIIVYIFRSGSYAFIDASDIVGPVLIARI